jgi:hypothetical protein
MTFDSAYAVLTRPHTMLPGRAQQWLTCMLAFFNAAVVIFDLTLFVR